MTEMSLTKIINEMKSVGNISTQAISELDKVLERVLSFCYQTLPQIAEQVYQQYASNPDAYDLSILETLIKAPWRAVPAGPFGIYVKKSKLPDMGMVSNLRGIDQNLESKLNTAVQIFQEAAKYQENFATLIKTDFGNVMSKIKKVSPYITTGANIGSVALMLGTLMMGGGVGLLPAVVGYTAWQAYSQHSGNKKEAREEDIKIQSLERVSQDFMQKSLPKIQKMVELL